MVDRGYSSFIYLDMQVYFTAALKAYQNTKNEEVESAMGVEEMP